MMSSEEETEFGLYADKLLKKAKRTRQRVDAGEPRNSYSSIPNFSSRPSFLGGNNNLYGAIFTQQQHFGLFGPGFGPAKMLNELLGRQKAESGGAGDSGDEVKFECSGARCDGASPPPGADLAAHHMLRDILQGRKHELLALAEHVAADPANNNNNNNNTESIKAAQRSERTTPVPTQPPTQQQQVGSGGESESREGSTERDARPDSGAGADKCETDSAPAEPMDETLAGMDTESLPSPKVEPASPAKPEDAKKARVENIVSGMRASPAPPQVNGCKKRKLYQPQQHDSAATSYIDEEDDELEPIRQQKRYEKNALKSQLRTMQEQLAEMQQKYVQLCTRMEQESNCEEVEEIASDSEDGLKRSSPATSPCGNSAPMAAAPSSAPPVALAQQVAKLKLGPTHHVPPHFNGMLHDHHHHPHMSNAAAMYLGVSHKLFLEQEARMAKEAAVAAAVAESQHHHQQQQQAQQQAQQQQQQQVAAAAAAAQQHVAAQHAAQQQQQQHHQQQQQQHAAAVAAAAAASAAQQHQQQTPPSAALPCKPDNIAERLNMIRNMTPTGSDLEGLADALKSEITASLSNIIDAIITRFVHQRRLKQSEASAAAEQLNKDLMLASQMLDRKSPRTKLAEGRAGTGPGSGSASGAPMMNGTGGPGYPTPSMMHMKTSSASEMHPRPPMFQPPKPPGMGQVPMFSGMGHAGFCNSERDNPEQNEALSLVVTPKKKRHKVTDTRITPRTVSRILAQDGMGMSPAGVEQPGCPSPRPYHQPPPPPMLPVSLPTSVAIPNPGLHESQVFSPYSPFFHGPTHAHHIPMQASSSPPGMNKLERESPPLPHPPTLLHPALLAAAQHGASPDYGHIRAPPGSYKMENQDQNSDCNSADISYDGAQPTSSTLTPMHLRKAKLMFFWVRYPSSAVLKMYFPDIKFNKNNTAQLVKWFSNFREFYYIQMEKYARQAVSEGVKNAEDLHVSGDSEIYRVLNLHYNRNNHIEVPSNFRFVVEQTLREFFKAIQGGKDAEQSWKKSIYKIISRLDDPVPEYFKSPNFLEQLE